MLKTPLNLLTEQISDCNFNKVFSCMKELIDHNANINAADKQEITPILNVLLNPCLGMENRRKIVEYLLRTCENIDIDTHREGEARKRIKPLLGHNHHLIPDEINRKLRFEDFQELLINRRQNKFLKALHDFEKRYPNEIQDLFSPPNTSETQGEDLLIIAIREDLAKAVKTMLQLGANVNHFVKDLSESPIYVACKKGSCQSLEEILKSKNLKADRQLLSYAISLLEKTFEPKEKGNVQKCFDLLLAYMMRINEKSVNWALSHAICNNKSEAIRESLKNGASLRNESNQLLRIDPKLLEKHFDGCITSDRCASKNEFTIDFNFKNLVHETKKHEKVDSEEGNKIDLSTLTPDEKYSCEQIEAKSDGHEMSAIEYISKSKDHKHLLMHPLIMCFMFIKWERLKLFFQINSAISILFAVLTYTYVYILCFYNNELGMKIILLRYSIWILTAYIVTREIVEIRSSPCNYFNNLEKYSEWILILVVALTLCDVFPSYRQYISVTLILLSALEILISTKSLPGFCIHYVLLGTVTKNFLKSSPIFLIILVAFSFSFHTLLHEPTKPNPNSLNSSITHFDDSIFNATDLKRFSESMQMRFGKALPSNNTDSYETFQYFLQMFANATNNEKNFDEINNDKDINTLSNIWDSIMKTLVMSTGEFDADSINLEGNFLNYLILIIFILLVPIILLNLLNGLAVSDTQAIMLEVELTNTVRRAQILARYERYSFSNENL